MKWKEFLQKLYHTEPTNKAFFVKDDEGQWWFLGIYSNHFKDLDGEILSGESHEEYANWLKETGFQPVITAYHLPRAPEGFWVRVFDKHENDVKTLQRIVDKWYEPFSFAKAERVIYLNGFAAVVAKVLPGREAIAENLSAIDNLGMSHGFISKETDVNIFKKYRTFEMSTLKGTRAANPFTLSQMLRGKQKMEKSNEKGLKPEDRDLLVRIFGAEVVDKFATKTEAMSKVLSGILEFKEFFMDENQEVVTEEVAETPADEVKEQEPAPALSVTQLATETGNTFTQLHGVITQMQQQIETLTKQNEDLSKLLVENTKKVADIEKSEDEKIASQFLPSFNWGAGYSPAQANDNVIDKKEKSEIVTAAPTGDHAKVDPENPMNLGFWSLLPTFAAAPVVNNE